ncbi:hypothetical protein C0995_010544, partial [Termitomyces sp. Mi166
MQPVNKVLLQCLEQAGQPVPATAAFLQDSLAIIVIEGLLNQIEMMKRQHVMALEHIKRAGKCKAPAYEELVMEPKWARALVRQPQEFVWAPVPTVVRPPPPYVQPPSSLSTLMPVHLDPVMPCPIQELDILAVVENPLAELLLEPRDEIMADTPAMQQGWRVEALYAPVMAPPSQFAVVVLTTDPRTPEQYDGLVATQQKTVTASKGKRKAVATIENESDYGQFSSEDEQESEE